MPSVKKYIDHAHDVLGMDRSASPNIAPQGKWFTCQDVRARDMRLETFPGMSMRFNQGLTLNAEFFEVSNENVESLTWYNSANAQYAYSANPAAVLPAIIINRVGVWPSDDSQNFNLCAVKSVGPLGFGTTNMITLTVAAGNTVNVYNGGSLIGNYAIAATVTVVIGSATVVFGFVPNPSDDAFDNFVIGTSFYFQHSVGFLNNSPDTQGLRPSISKWGNTTFFIRGSQLYKRQNNVYLPLMYSIMASQNFQYALYSEIYQRHLILAAGQNGSSVFWSNLNDMDDFLPTFFNESDVYPILDVSRVNQTPLNITGVKNLGVYCYIYTPETIWRMIYVGLPKVMFLQEVGTQVGSHFMYGLVSAGVSHFFITASNFYMFDGTRPQVIGDPIKLFFFSDLSTDLQLQKKVWGYYNYRSEEVMWFYPSTNSTGDIDRCLYYHIPTKSWYYRNVPNVKWAYDLFFSDQLVSVQGSNQPLSGDLAYMVPTVGVVADALPAEEADLYTNYAKQNPVLQSNTFIYDSPQDYKDVDSVYFDTAYTGNIQVGYSFTKYISDPAVYTIAQIWNRSDSTGRISLPRSSGRSFRYEFVFLPVNDIVTRSRIYAWGENVFVTQADQ